jgi:hypothetical protein
MTNPYDTIILILILPYTCLILNWGIRIGKALQKDIPPVPLAEPVQKATEIVKKIGKRTVRLVSDIKELKSLKKVEKDEVDQWN